MIQSFARKTRVAVLAGCSVVALTGGSVADTLGDALVNAYKASGLIEQNRALLRAADEDVVSAMAALGPLLRWSAQVQQTFGEAQTSGITSDLNGTDGTLALIGSLTIYDAGGGKLAVEAAKETVLATRDTLVDIEQQVLSRAVSAFMNVREGIETVALRKNNVRVIQQELRAAQDRFDVGEITRSDVAQAEARLAESRANLAVAEGNLAITRAEYVAAVGPVPSVLTPPSGLPRIPSLSEAISVAQTQSPALRSAQRQVTVAELTVARARAAMAPRVTIEGQLALNENFGNTNNSRSGSISLGASQTLYDGGGLSSALRAAEAQRDAARAVLHLTSLQVAQNVRSTYAQLTAARAQIEASDRRIRAARVAFRGVREEATLGARTTLDVLNAEQTLLDAQAAAIAASADQYIAAYQVLQSMGLLTAEKLSLNVPTYDPAAYYNMVAGQGASSTQGNALDRIMRGLGGN
jgi:outer membrane protein